MTLPYRPNVGIALFNRAGLVFAGRSHAAGPERIEPGFEWQMPQGGIEPDEEIVSAARRELAEETRVTSVSLLAATDEWWAYDFPPYDGPPHKLSVFRGQRQTLIQFLLGFIVLRQAVIGASQTQMRRDGAIVYLDRA